MNTGSLDEEIKLAILLGITGAALAMGLVRKLMNYIHTDRRMDQMEDDIEEIRKMQGLQLKSIHLMLEYFVTVLGDLDTIKENTRIKTIENNDMDSCNTDLISESSNSQHE